MSKQPKISRRRLLQIGCILAPTLGMPALTTAQPERSVRMLVPTSPGSSADLGARAAGQGAQKVLGRTLVVENKVGAGGSVAIAALAAAEPNGETIGVFGNSYLLFPVEFPGQKFDPMKDVVPVAMISHGANVLLVAASSPYSSLADIVKKASAAPGTLSYASAGQGSSTFQSAERVIRAAKLDMVHLPFKGSPESLNEVIAGRVDFAFAPVSVALPLIRSGRLKPIAVSPSKRSSFLPQVPTTAESLPGSSYESWLAVLVPAKTPLAQQQELNKAFTAGVQSPEVQQVFNTMGVEASPMPLDELKAYVRREYDAAMAYEKASKLR